MTDVVVANEDGIVRAAAALRAGQVVAYPTEGVYGLGCDPTSAHAIAHILRLKGRSATKGLILLADRWDVLEPYVDLAQGHFAVDLPLKPEPRTWIFPARPGVSPLLTGEHEGIALRVTTHPIAAALSASLGGPLISTSANRSGFPPARSALETIRSFPAGLGLILDGPLGGLAGPTEIRDARDGRIIRPAPFTG